MGLLVIWGMLGAVVAIIANSKGFDTFGWFVYGALTGPVALTHVIVKPAAESQKPVIIEAQKQCPDCAETIKADAMVCRYCGNRSFPDTPEMDEADQWFASLQPPMSKPRPTAWQKLWWNPHAGDRRR